MIFNISMSLFGWLIAFFAALFLMVIPFIAIGSLANNFPEPISILLTVIGSYLLWPVFVAWLYKTKLRNTGRGSVIFYFYVALYFLSFLLLLSRAFEGNVAWHDYLGILVLGSVSFGLMYYAYKTKAQFTSDVRTYQTAVYEAEREEDINRQTEAILRAEKLKDEQKHNKRQQRTN